VRTSALAGCQGIEPVLRLKGVRLLPVKRVQLDGSLYQKESAPASMALNCPDFVTKPSTALYSFGLTD
jgi:hypothetical protein